MTVFEVETWKVIPGKEYEHQKALRVWMQWVKENKDLFPEWKSLRYFVKYIAGKESERHMMIWEYDSLAAFESYKARRKDYEGPYKEYKKIDPYYMGLFEQTTMSVEVWKDQERDLWQE
jgi:hypothetical protein